jgi:hypothetical protein
MNPGLPDRLWRHADRPAGEPADRCCAAMTFEQKVAVALGAEEARATGSNVLLVVHQGRYEILVGRSSRDIWGRAGFEVGARTPLLR